MYRVIKAFFDLQDENHAYSVGDEYPRKGFKPTDSRIAALISTKNAQRQPLIEEVKEKVEKKESKKK